MLHLLRTLRRTPPVLMPEGPECRVHAERLHKCLCGRNIVRATILSGRYAGSPPANWELLQSSLPATIDAVQSHGKFIYWTLTPASALATSDVLSVWSPLGMTGAWARERTAHSRVAFELDSGDENSGTNDLVSVSYTHLTLPTICSV